MSNGGEIEAYTGTHVLLEVAHRLMMIEAVDKGLVTPGNVPGKLRRRPELASQLNGAFRCYPVTY